MRTKYFRKSVYTGDTTQREYPRQKSWEEFLKTRSDLARHIGMTFQDLVRGLSSQEPSDLTRPEMAHFILEGPSKELKVLFQT